MLRLHLLRHAEPKIYGPFSSDKERPLSSNGVDQCATLKNKLNLDWATITIWCSTAARTHETALNVLNNKTFNTVNFKDELYHASIDTLLQLIITVNNTKELMLIGHNNGISDLFNYLSDSTTTMQTGHYVCLDFPLDHWTEVSRSTAMVVHELVP